jgi:hypothetical protein
MKKGKSKVKSQNSKVKSVSEHIVYSRCTFDFCLLTFDF